MGAGGGGGDSDSGNGHLTPQGRQEKGPPEICIYSVITRKGVLVSRSEWESGVSDQGENSNSYKARITSSMVASSITDSKGKTTRGKVKRKRGSLEGRSMTGWKRKRGLNSIVRKKRQGRRDPRIPSTKEHGGDFEQGDGGGGKGKKSGYPP